MSPTGNRLAREQAKARRRRRARRAVMPGLFLVCGIALLFTLAWGANEKEQLARRQTRLVQQREYEAEQLQRLQSNWTRDTARDKIVPRAVAELELVDVSEQPKEVLVLREPPPIPPSDLWLARVARAARRFGQVPEAAAKEQRP